jgi:hypothetical protein
MYPTARRKGLKRYPFARFGLSGKRYREPPVPRKARSGRRPDAPNIKLYIFKPKTAYIFSVNALTGSGTNISIFVKYFLTEENSITII